MKYAVVKISGSQYKVSEGDEIEVSRFPEEEGKTIELKEVLLLVDGKQVKIGKPMIKEAQVVAKVMKQFLGEKVDIFKFRAKTGYRRKTGFRAQRTLLKIEKIS
ncbi:MAG: 50S ribosomal protein L21 [Patescibacteria group bacterium]|nr:50S ribosomal protein L21 [Patescibacteria group bacterium]